MTDDKQSDDAALDALFASAKTSPELDEAFTARLLADATKAAEAHAQRPAPRVQRIRPSIWSRWLPASGLTAATLAGFWIGVALPTSDIGAAYLTSLDASETELVDFVPTFGVGEWGVTGE